MLRLSGGGLRAVLECPTLHFGIKGEADQRAVIHGWSQLLNSLSHPLQVLIRTRSLKEPGSAKAEGSGAEARLRRSYAELLAALAEQRQLVDRHFSVVVPWDPSVGSMLPDWLSGRRRSDEAAEEGMAILEQRVAWLSESLGRIDLEPRRLVAFELATLLYQTLCPASAASQPLPSEDRYDDLTEVIAPAVLEEHASDLVIDGRLVRTLAITRYPSRLRPAWLESLLAVEGDLDVSLHIQPAPTPVVMSFLDRRVAELSSTIRVADERGGRADPYRRAALADAMELQDGLARGEERLFDVSLYLTAWADGREVLERLCTEVESALGSQLIQSRRQVFRMQPALMSSLPLGLDQVGMSRSLSTSALAATFPFTGNDLPTKEGLLYGVNTEARTQVLLDRFSLENHNAVVFATSGAGKSYLVKVELLRAHLAGIRAQVIDPEGEYAGLVETLGGEVTEVRAGRPMPIDPFRLAAADELESRITSLLSLLELLAQGLSPLQRAAAEDALSFLYAAHGYHEEADNASRTAPAMAELQQLLERRSRQARGDLRPALEELALKLRRYSQGAGSWLFKSGPIPADTCDLRAYVLAELPEEDRAPAMFMVLEQLWSGLEANSQPALVVVDEAWWLMQYADSARFLFRLAKTARKRRAGLTLVTQDVSDVLASPLGAAAVTNSALQVLLKQSPQAIDEVAQLFRLTTSEQSWLLNARPGEGLLLAQGKRVPFHVVASEEEARLIAAAEKRRRAA